MHGCLTSQICVWLRQDHGRWMVTMLMILFFNCIEQCESWKCYPRGKQSSIISLGLYVYNGTYSKILGGSWWILWYIQASIYSIPEIILSQKLGFSKCACPAMVPSKILTRCVISCFQEWRYRGSETCSIDRQFCLQRSEREKNAVQLYGCNLPEPEKDMHSDNSQLNNDGGYTDWGLADSAVITRGSKDAVLLAANLSSGKIGSALF